jgi:hypothetical protein
MKNAHLRMGSLRFTKVLRDTTIDITLRMDPSALSRTDPPVLSKSDPGNLS